MGCQLVCIGVADLLTGKLRKLLGVLCVGAVMPLCSQSASPQPASPQPAPAVSPLTVPEPPGTIASLLAKAKTYLGTVYRYGGMSPKGFDCSGFVSYVFSSVGVDLDRSSGSQARQGEPIDLAHIQPGDLLFFSTRGMRKGISHVGIYLGEGQFIHASSWGGRGKNCVKFGELASKYFAERLVSARRMVTQLTTDEKTP